MGEIIEIVFIIVFIMVFVPLAMVIGIKLWGQYFEKYVEWLADKFDI